MNFEELRQLGAAGDIEVMEEPRTMIKDLDQLWDFIRENKKKEEYQKNLIRRARKRGRK